MPVRPAQAPRPGAATSALSKRPGEENPVNKTAVKAPSSAQPLKKPAAKAAVKSGSKPAAKPVVKPAAKTAPKPASSSAPQKTVAQAPAKVAPVAAKSPAAKSPAAKNQAAKPASKAAAKPPVSASPKPAGTPATKPAQKSTATPAATPAAKLPGKAAAPTKTVATATPKPKVAAKASGPTSSTPSPVLANKTPVAVKPVAPPPPTGPAVPPTPTAPPKARGNKNSAKYLPAPELQVVASQTAFAPTPPVSNRFMDRFAPARPSKLPDPIEVQKSTYKADPKLVNAWKTKAGRDLTEPELLAMPDPEYMNDKQLDFFRRRLQQQRDDLLSNAGETTEHLREDTSIVPDPADRATIEEEHALELRTRDRERKLLKKIAQSLTRLETGDYGFCDETSEPIGLARLMARPTATLSLEAQQRRELKQKMFGN